MKLRFIKNRKLNCVALWNLFLGLVSVPVNIIVASSLSNAVSIVAGGTRDVFFYNAILFVIFSLIGLLIIVFRKSYITLAESRARQSYKQSLYSLFMGQALDYRKNAAGNFATLFRRDAEHICTFYITTLPAFGVAVIGFVAYMLYVIVALQGILFAVCMVLLGMLSLLQPIILEKFLIKNFIAADEAESALAQHLTTGREGFAGMKLFKLHEWFMERYRPRQDAYRKAGIRASASGTFHSSMDDINKFMQTLGLVSILGWAILKQWTAMENALQIYILSGSIYAYITTIFQMKSDSASYRAALGQVDKYLSGERVAEKEECADRKRLVTFPVGSQRAAEICLSGLSYQMNEKVLMEDISITISPGEKCLLRGENGIGKSTLLGLIMGEIAHFGGQITLNGEVITPNHSGEKIAYCPQAAPTLQCTVHELYHSVLGAQNNISEQLLYQYAKELGLSDEDMGKNISTLSGGNQKKVFLCLALAKGAPLLLLDEPEAMLDHEAVVALLGILSKKECTVIVVSHNDIYMDIIDSVLMFKEQRLVRQKPHECHTISQGE